MKTKQLNAEELKLVNGGSSSNSASVETSVSTDSLLSFSTETHDDEGNYRKTSFSVGNGIDLNVNGVTEKLSNS